MKTHSDSLFLLPCNSSEPISNRQRGITAAHRLWHPRRPTQYRTILPLYLDLAKDRVYDNLNFLFTSTTNQQAPWLIMMMISSTTTKKRYVKETSHSSAEPNDSGVMDRIFDGLVQSWRRKLRDEHQCIRNTTLKLSLLRCNDNTFETSFKSTCTLPCLPFHSIRSPLLISSSLTHLHTPFDYHTTYSSNTHESKRMKSIASRHCQGHGRWRRRGSGKVWQKGSLRGHSRFGI
jgi:hypothetical protein